LADAVSPAGVDGNDNLKRRGGLALSMVSGSVGIGERDPADADRDGAVMVAE